MDETSQTNNLAQQIATYVIVEAGFNTLPQPQLREYQQRLAVEIQRRIGLITLQWLDDEGRKKLEEFSKGGKRSEDDYAKFFTGAIEDYDERLERYLEDFSKEMIEKLKR